MLGENCYNMAGRVPATKTTEGMMSEETGGDSEPQKKWTENTRQGRAKEFLDKKLEFPDDESDAELKQAFSVKQAFINSIISFDTYTAGDITVEDILEDWGLVMDIIAPMGTRERDVQENNRSLMVAALYAVDLGLSGEIVERHTLQTIVGLANKLAENELSQINDKELEVAVKFLQYYADKMATYSMQREPSAKEVEDSAIDYAALPLMREIQTMVEGSLKAESRDPEKLYEDVLQLIKEKLDKDLAEEKKGELKEYIQEIFSDKDGGSRIDLIWKISSIARDQFSALSLTKEDYQLGYADFKQAIAENAEVASQDRALCVHAISLFQQLKHILHPKEPSGPGGPL